jgi:CheY-like chemotaxis protein
VPRILLVDDDIAEISAVKRVLLRAGHQAILATNSSDALAVIAQGMPGLALISATCENGEGLALARRLRDDSRMVKLPVILLGESRDGALSAPQLARPIDPAQLAEQMQAALEASDRQATKPLGKVQLAALSKGSLAPSSASVGRSAGRSAEGAERRAAADALRQRADELRRGATARQKATADGGGPASAAVGLAPSPPESDPERTVAETRSAEAEARLGIEGSSIDIQAPEKEREAHQEEVLGVDPRAEAEWFSAV